jgi:DNA-directed RNA polymerase specialized sigma24 family protein
MEQENKYIRSLVDNARRGKIGALEELFEMCLSDIFTLIIRLTGNKKLAEQFTKETLVTAWKEINKKAPENISFENWLRNIAIKTTICGLIGSKDCKEKTQKKLSKDDDQSAAFSTDLLENAIAGLDDKSRAIFVLNKIDGKPLTTFSGFLGVNKSDAETILSDSVLNISSLLPNVESEADLDTLVESLPSKIQPDEDLLESALGEINEIRIKELKEKDDASEELQELIEFEKKRMEIRKNKKSGEKIVYKKEQKLKSSDKIIISVLLVISLVSFILYLITSTNEWMLFSLSGKPLKNKAPIVKMEELLAGDVISTNDVSSAGIDISDIGRINIFGNTSLTKLEDDNSAELHNGKLMINTVKAEDNLYIVIPNAKIENIDICTKYLVDVDSQGNSKIVLEEGWLRVSSGNDEIIFPEKYNLKVFKESGTSIPYYSESDLILITLFEEYLFNGNEKSTLNGIIKSSTIAEAIMLWNLLQRIKAEQRITVYNKLNELVPHPDNITKKGILSLDRNMLQFWLDEIKWYL